MTTSASPGDLFVTTNVARDILQSAGVFKDLKTVVWEYVVNSLEYVDQNVIPKVVVTIDARRRTVEVADNARGMNRLGLGDYFSMHAKNKDRAAGKPGRGFFGTGKSAAFAVGDILIVRTVKSGKRNIVQLTRSGIEAEDAKDGNSTRVPITSLENDSATPEENGTIISIEGVHGKIDARDVLKYIERKISRGFKNAEVVINGHLVEHDEPPYQSSYAFVPNNELHAILGDVTLTIKVSLAPLDEATRGIDVMSDGNLFETTLASVANKEMSQYLFGEIDVPKLANEGDGPNPAFTMSRDGRLNPANPLVAAIHTFISINLDEVRRKLVEDEKERRKTADAKRLARNASEIANLLNEDFNEYKKTIERTNKAMRGASHDQTRESENGVPIDLEAIIFGGEEDIGVLDQADIEKQAREENRTDGSNNEPGGQFLSKPNVDASTNGDRLGTKTKQTEGKQPGRGGFNVQYRSMGANYYRAEYDKSTRTIVINLDFPPIRSALAVEGIEGHNFRRLSNEFVFSEYALGITAQLAENNHLTDPSDYFYEIRSVINRLSRKTGAAT